ncbi:alpha/beta fold hydrolase [Nocardia sp. CDC159]|uniref:Alpha/beta fold hydrolase n=1 Tax=Nocardia pulmonis TaxID=2951408 RepID=A0A9X2IX36_9NOCA|nr:MULTISPECIES: alpha/beta fold hydrolase [Nocardia]MCM6774219.1 alpha/beta fold hydrolase [Nocardia pulmonis]MCM6787106.1 alpha/beta fold hydrolase [Nocardia sp. CDC159]
MTEWNRIDRGTGRPLVLLHGAGGTARNWLPVIDRLAEHRRVIALDFPGFGRTPFPDDPEFTMDWVMDQLAAEFARLGLDGPVDLAGNSMGGWFALEAAKRGMAASVVAIAPAGLWRGAGMPGLLYAQFQTALLFGLCTRGVGGLALHLAPVRLAGLALVAAHPERIPKRAGIGMIRDLDRSHRALRLAVHHARSLRFEGGRELEVPITVAFGTRDLMLLPAVSQCRDQLPAHTRWITLPGCGHVPMSDEPELVARVILDGSSVGERVREIGA